MYCPDFLVNAGGVIQVADELHGFSFDRARRAHGAIHDATLAVLRTAEAEGITPTAAADRLAERRIAGVSGGAADLDRCAERRATVTLR